MYRALLLLWIPSLAYAADWPQWRGPDRTSISKEMNLLKDWPASGPRLLWTSDQTGVGYSGPAIVGNRLYIMGAEDGKDLLLAFDTATGKRVWSAEVGPFLENGWGGGPRGTPTVVGDLIYALGGKGDLVCIKSDGSRVWAVNLVSDLGGKVPFWAYSESPLVDGEVLICTPGGSKGTLAGLNRLTGKVVWRSADWKDAADYASIAISTAHNSRQYIQMAAASIGGVDAKTGKLMWKFPRKQRITIPTPIPFGNFVYITSGYGVGCNLLELTSATEIKEVYANVNMVNHHGGVILLDGHVYGHSDSKGWICQDVKTGEIVWQSRKLAKGSIVHAGGHIYCYAETDGTLARIEATSKGWIEKGRFTIPKTSSLPRPPSRSSANFWTHPVIANGKLYLRDQELLFCYDVSGANP